MIFLFVEICMLKDSFSLPQAQLPTRHSSDDEFIALIHCTSIFFLVLFLDLGLGVYSSSSDEDSDGEKSEGPKSDVSDWEPESALKVRTIIYDEEICQKWLTLFHQERIRVKTIAFEQKAKEIKERLAKIEEAEQENFNKKRDEHSKRHDSDSEKSQKPKSRKNFTEGEEKYEQINSISGSFGKFDDFLLRYVTCKLWGRSFLKRQIGLL